MRTLVFNGWAAGPEAWSLTTFPRDWTFSYLEQLDGLPEKILAEFDSVVLVGFSMGGNSVLRLLLRFPEKVRGLVLISTTPFMMEEKSVGWRGLSERRLAALRLGTQLAFRENPSPLYEVGNMDRGLEYLKASDQRAALLDPAFFAGNPHLLRIPVSIFQSERDGIVRPENAAWLKGVFPQASVKMIPGGEHVLPITIPEQIDAAVYDILKIYAET